MKIKKYRVDPETIENWARIILAQGRKKFWPFTYLDDEDAIGAARLAVLENVHDGVAGIYRAAYRELWALFKSSRQMRDAKGFARYAESDFRWSSEDLDLGVSIMKYYKNHTWPEVCHRFGLDEKNERAQKELSRSAQSKGIEKERISGKARGPHKKIAVKPGTTAKDLHEIGVPYVTAYRAVKRGYFYASEKLQRKIDL